MEHFPARRPAAVLAQHRAEPISRHLEVETYLGRAARATAPELSGDRASRWVKAQLLRYSRRAQARPRLNLPTVWNTLAGAVLASAASFGADSP
jgi:hypothetical protein